MYQLIADIKSFLDVVLSLGYFYSTYIYSVLLGIVVGAFVTYNLMVNRKRIMIANDAYQTLYSAFFLKLATIKMNIELKKKEHGTLNFTKLNKESKKSKNISLVAQQILDVSDDFHKMVTKYNQVKFSTNVVSRYFAVEQIKEQIRLAETSALGSGEEIHFRKNRVARLHYQLATVKISFVQAVLEDMQKIAKAIRMKDKETKETIRFFLQTCKAAREKGLSKMYGIEESEKVKVLDEEGMLAG